MTGFARVTGRSLRLVRTRLELTVLVAGWLLGGVVGVGTVAYALGIGPLAQLFLRWFDTGDRSKPISGRALGGEPRERAGQSLVEVDDRPPAELAGDQRGVRPAHPRVVDHRSMCRTGERDWAAAITRCASSSTVNSPGLPTLTGPPSSLPAMARIPRTVSSTKQTERVCCPSPVTVNG